MWVLDALNQRKDSDAVAIIYREQQKSFSDIWKESEKLGGWINSNLKSDAPVVIYGNKNTEIISAMFGALKSGRAYIPIDITFPEERVNQIVNITKAEVVFNFSDITLEIDSNVILLEKNEISEILNSNMAEPIPKEKWIDGDDNAYILFTSGSTGEPKGVQISKNNILNFCEWFSKDAAIEGDVVLNQVSYSFDVSVIQIYLYLAMGKTLFCIDKEMIGDFGLLFSYLEKSNIASWVSTPAFIEMCAVYDVFNQVLLPKLEKVILAGEVLTKKLVNTLWEKFPGVKVINGYGPTEGTVLLSACEITKEMVDDNDNELPIGFMLSDAVYSIDCTVNQNDDVKQDKFKDSERGELIVTSRSISKGYYKNPEATNKSFFKSDGDAIYNSYRTGDIVYQKGELIYYCGRKDFQIKLNGYRIELDDISENINKIDGVNNNIVLPVYRDGRVALIATFIVFEKDVDLQGMRPTIYIRKKLSELIPSYMIPKKIISLEKFPLNTNGKIDRKMLKEMYL